MSLGLGSDLIDIRRIEQAIERFGDRFLDRIFTAAERRKCDRRANPAASYARRFAAKEACSKALGTGFRHGVFWRVAAHDKPDDEFPHHRARQSPGWWRC